MRNMIFLGIISVVMLFGGCSDENKDEYTPTPVSVAAPLPAWQEGELDIHFINTGRGECTWQILPDGTTFLVDVAGSMDKTAGSGSNPTPFKPDDETTAGKVIADYIEHFSPEVSKGHINYFLLTHHHADHGGQVTSECPYHESGLFRLNSLAEVGTRLIMDTIFDRDYPEFSYPTLEDNATTLVQNFRSFLSWTESVNGTHVEKWDVGSYYQVFPVYKPSYDVTIRNYSGNGWFWTGSGTDFYSDMPTSEEFATLPSYAFPDENCYSCSYMLSYGDFDFFLGGDLQYANRDRYSYMDTETPIANIGHKVEVMKADHHGVSNSQDAGLMEVLRPDVWVVNVWKEIQPVPEVVDNVLAANPNCDIFTTNMVDYNVVTLGAERLTHFASTYGHVVIRVAKGGGSFMVYTLEDSDPFYMVKSVHGPYECTK